MNILHLSDTHFRGADRREHAKIEQVRRATAGEEIDLLIHTGDFLHRDSGLDNVLALIDSIPKPRLGAYAVTGNHDHVFYNMRSAPQYSWRLFRAREAKNGGCNGALNSSEKVKFSSEGLGDLYRFGRHLLSNRFDGEPAGENDIGGLRRALEERGMQFLDNRAVQLGETGVYLVGIEDLMEGQPDLDGSLEGVPRDAPTVLLSHNPDIVEAAAAGRADLILAGHTHGGQIVLPLIGPTYTQTEQLSRGEASGYSRRGKTQVYVHRGLGEGVPVRFGAPPHVTFIRLLPARRDSVGGAGRDGNRG
ncbi:MAG: metallophosphoesterase [bacterium]|nr:metallophosphoesterase [bacterium]